MSTGLIFKYNLKKKLCQWVGVSFRQFIEFSFITEPAVKEIKCKKVYLYMKHKTSSNHLCTTISLFKKIKKKTIESSVV